MNDNKKMKSNRQIARIVGALFIIATAAGIISVSFLDPVLKASNLLMSFYENQNQVVFGALFDLLGAAAFVILAIVIYPVLKVHNEGIAQGYIIARTIEAVPFLVANISLLACLSISKTLFLESGATPEISRTLQMGFMAVYDWGQILGPKIIASLAALPLYYLLFKSKLLPRWIPIWGLCAAPLYLVSGLLGMFNIVDAYAPLTILLFLPAALLEMVMAVWMIAKGFNEVPK